jgi:RNA 3'-terminal phosphate cyclase (ATP)
LPRHIAERECRTVAQRTGWDDDCFTIEERNDVAGAGHAGVIEGGGGNVTEVFTSFGRIGVKAEKVAGEALDEAEKYVAADVPVGEYLADQLLLPLGIGAHLGTGGGTFRTMPLSSHATTHIEILRQFLGVAVAVEEDERATCVVRVGA